MFRPIPELQLIRRASIGLLAALLLLAASSSSAVATGPEFYGPCLANADVATSKCLHYKLLEAKRLGNPDGRDCSQPSIVLRDGVLFYWEYGS